MKEKKKDKLYDKRHHNQSKKEIWMIIWEAYLWYISQRDKYAFPYTLSENEIAKKITFTLSVNSLTCENLFQTYPDKIQNDYVKCYSWWHCKY